VRVLVTGGAGFLGSHLIDRLMQNGDEVMCLDNFYSGKKQNIIRWIDRPNFELIRHDITEPIILEVDRIYHLACPASPADYQYNPIKTIKTNVLGTMNMLGLAKRVNARFFLASSSEVYGDPDTHPQQEDYWGNVNPIGVRSCYEEGKRMAEALTYDYHRQHGIEVRVARIFNTYGSRMLENDGRVVSNFLFKALRGKPISVYGDGTQTRSFCHVSDTIEGLVRVMENEYYSYPINIGNQEECSIVHLASTISRMVDNDTEIIFDSLPAGDPPRRCPDITRAKTLLNWEAKVSLEEGLKLTIADFRQKLEMIRCSV
jgi:UDP-glucuronate decarboxylase